MSLLFDAHCDCGLLSMFSSHDFHTALPLFFYSPLRSPIAVAVTLILGIDTKFSQRVVHPPVFVKTPLGWPWYVCRM